MEKKKEVVKINEQKFDIYEEIGVHRINQSVVDKLRNLSSDQKRFILKENTGVEYRTSDENELRNILQNKNIKEVTVEEVRFDGAKREVIQLEETFENREKLLESERENNSKEFIKSSSNFVLACENFLNLEESKERSQVYSLTQNDPSEDVLLLKKRFVSRSRDIHTNFFRIKNNSELFKIGKSFLEDYSEGKSCFGVSSNGNFHASARTLYGLSTFFNFYSHTRALIFAGDEEIRHLSDVLKIEETKTIYDNSLDITYEVYESEGITIVNYSVFEGEQAKAVYDLLDKLTKLSGVTFCSLPSVESIEKNIDLYFQIFQRIDNVSLILEKNNTDLKNVKKLLADFKNYNVSLKGVLINGIN